MKTLKQVKWKLLCWKSSSLFSFSLKKKKSESTGFTEMFVLLAAPGLFFCSSVRMTDGLLCTPPPPPPPRHRLFLLLCQICSESNSWIHSVCGNVHTFTDVSFNTFVTVVCRDVSGLDHFWHISCSRCSQDVEGIRDELLTSVGRSSLTSSSAALKVEELFLTERLRRSRSWCSVVRK